MTINAISKKVGMATLAAAMTAAPAINVFAAPEDIIDTTKVGSLVLHKYDTTAAEEDGVYTPGVTFTANGHADSAAEETLADYVIEGVEFTYLKVGDISTETVNGKIEVMYDIPAELQTILGLTTDRTDNKYTSTDINNALKNILTDNTTSKNKLEEYIQSTNGAVAMDLTNEKGVTSASNLPLGLYLLVETKVPANVHTTVDPFFVSLPMTENDGSAWFYNVEVYPKNQTNIPDIDKLVRQHDDVALNKPEYKDTATTSEGEQNDFIITSHLPKITSESSYLTKYEFVDTLSKGLSYNKDAKIYFYDNETDAKANNTEKAVVSWDEGEYFSTTYVDGDGAESTADFVISDAGLAQINPNYSEMWIVIAYSTTTHTDTSMVLGDKGNPNDVDLIWRRTSMPYEDTIEDRSKLFSYGLDITKKFKATSDSAKDGDATKVQFSLQNKSDGHYVTAKCVDGVYYVTDATKGSAESEGTAFSPQSDGSLIIKGLEADTYVLTEIQTCDGYTLLKEPITIVINSTEDDITPSHTTLYDKKDIEANAKVVTDILSTKASATVDNSAAEMLSENLDSNSSSDDTDEPETDSDVVVNAEETPDTSDNATISTNAYVKMEVTNTSTFTLPNTGGAGTIAFTVAGCAVAFAGVAVATKGKKKKEDK